MPPKPDRLNIEISSTAKQRVEHLRQMTDAASISEVVRRALATYDALLAEKNRGARVVVILADGREKELLLP